MAIAERDATRRPVEATRRMGNSEQIDKKGGTFDWRVHKFNLKYVNLSTEAFYFVVNLIESSRKICKCRHNTVSADRLLEVRAWR